MGQVLVTPQSLKEHVEGVLGVMAGFEGAELGEQEGMEGPGLQTLESMWGGGFRGHGGPEQSRTGAGGALWDLGVDLEEMAWGRLVGAK